ACHPHYETLPRAPRQAKTLAGSLSLPRPPPWPRRLRHFLSRCRGFRRPSLACLGPCGWLFEERQAVHAEGLGPYHNERPERRVAPLPHEPYATQQQRVTAHIPHHVRFIEQKRRALA